MVRANVLITPIGCTMVDADHVEKELHIASPLRYAHLYAHMDQSGTLLTKNANVHLTLSTSEAIVFFANKTNFMMPCSINANLSAKMDSFMTSIFKPVDLSAV
jgi:hypothetical protein